MTSLESRASALAAKWHASVDQRRKYTGEPYIVHPCAVAQLVRTVPHTEEMLALAWLHDVLEDTPCTKGELVTEVGLVVANMVEMLTHTSKATGANRAARKALDREHVSKASVAAKTVKVADRIDNVRSIATTDPKFAPLYLEETRLLLPALEGADPTLLGMLRVIVGGDAIPPAGPDRDLAIALELGWQWVTVPDPVGSGFIQRMKLPSGAMAAELFAWSTDFGKLELLEREIGYHHLSFAVRSRSYLVSGGHEAKVTGRGLCSNWEAVGDTYEDAASAAILKALRATRGERKAR